MKCLSVAGKQLSYCSTIFKYDNPFNYIHWIYIKFILFFVNHHLLVFHIKQELIILTFQYWKTNWASCQQYFWNGEAPEWFEILTVKELYCQTLWFGCEWGQTKWILHKPMPSKGLHYLQTMNSFGFASAVHSLQVMETFSGINLYIHPLMNTKLNKSSINTYRQADRQNPIVMPPN